MAEITEYRFGHIVIDGEEHDKDVIVLPDRVVRNWWRKSGHSLVVDDFGDLVDDLPGNLVIGCGAYGRMKPEPSAVRELTERGIEVEVLPTEDAVKRYRELDPQRTAAALHLTC